MCTTGTMEYDGSSGATIEKNRGQHSMLHGVAESAAAALVSHQVFLCGSGAFKHQGTSALIFTMSSISYLD